MGSTGSKCPALAGDKEHQKKEMLQVRQPPLISCCKKQARFILKPPHCRDTGSPLLSFQAPRAFAFFPGCQDAQALPPQTSTQETA